MNTEEDSSEVRQKNEIQALQVSGCFSVSIVFSKSSNFTIAHFRPFL